MPCWASPSQALLSFTKGSSLWRGLRLRLALPAGSQECAHLVLAICAPIKGSTQMPCTHNQTHMLFLHIPLCLSQSMGNLPTLSRHVMLMPLGH